MWGVFAERHGHQVDIVVPKRWRAALNGDIRYTFDTRTDRAFRRIHAVPCLFSGNASLFVFDPFRLCRILGAESYDAIVLAQETWALSLTAITVLKTFGPNLKTPVYIWVCQNIKKRRLYSLRFLERFNCLSVASILCCNSEIKSVVEWKGLNRRCRYFPFSFDGSAFTVTRSMAASGKTVLGYMGRISEEKGIAMMMRVFGRLHRKHPRIELLVAGSGPMVAAVLGVEGVRYLGIIPHDRAHTFYRRIDILLTPSQTRTFWKEQFGRVIIEAAASGRAVVGSSSGAIPEVLRSLGMPYIFKEDSERDFLEVIERALADRASGRMAARVQQARRSAMERYSHDRVADHLQHILRDDRYAVL
jgi:glycosyltransferase involved in cell wall biosynthesis